MKKEQIEKLLRSSVIKINPNINLEEITDNIRIQDDLGFDSLDTIELIMEIENVFNISITDKELENDIKNASFSEIVNLLIRKIG